MKKIYFDMDGTIANLYAVEDWLKKLRAYDPAPYAQAEPLVNMSRLARYIHKAQASGYKVGIISWLSKESTVNYDEAVTAAKLSWLARHLPSVSFDEIKIVSYGEPKQECVFCAENSILFDDEERNRKNWTGLALDQNQIFNFFKSVL